MSVRVTGVNRTVIRLSCEVSFLLLPASGSSFSSSHGWHSTPPTASFSATPLPPLCLPPPPLIISPLLPAATASSNSANSLLGGIRLCPPMAPVAEVCFCISSAAAWVRMCLLALCCGTCGLFPAALLRGSAALFAPPAFCSAVVGGLAASAAAASRFRFAMTAAAPLVAPVAAISSSSSLQWYSWLPPSRPRFIIQPPSAAALCRASWSSLHCWLNRLCAFIASARTNCYWVPLRVLLRYQPLLERRADGTPKLPTWGLSRL